MIKVAVLGAGINGITCAIKIKEKYPSADVVIFADEFTPNTTGDGSGGLWYPYQCGTTSEHLLSKWGIETYKFLQELWREGGLEITLLPLYKLVRNKEELAVHEWAEYVHGYRLLEERQLEYLSKMYNIHFLAGRTFNTFTAYPPTLIAYLYKRFLYASGRMVQHKVTSLDDDILAEYDVIINCLGLGAREVVPDDNVYPIRGQLTRVTAPWINHSVFDDESGSYIIPNNQLCILGGTSQRHDYNRNIDDKDLEKILNGCQTMIPGLKHATFVNNWTGLRPGREQIRLETEERNGKIYIHNYGHGGSGLTLFWGCGTEVLKRFEEHIMIRKSKL